MWLKGHGGSTFTLCLASPAEGCPGRTTMTRYWSPLSAAHRHGGRAVLAAQVVTFDMSGSGAVNRYGAEPRDVH